MVVVVVVVLLLLLVAGVLLSSVAALGSSACSRVRPWLGLELCKWGCSPRVALLILPSGGRCRRLHWEIRKRIFLIKVETWSQRGCLL